MPSAALYAPGDGFWDILWSAEWAATVGLPLLVTITSVGIAYLLVRGQLRHDRHLAAAQRRADAAGRLGNALINLQREFEDKSPVDPWWDTGKWPHWASVYEAIEEARIVLDEEAAFEYAAGVSRCISHGWEACQRRRNEMETSSNPPTDNDFADALVDTLIPYTDRLYDLGKHLIRWDGRERVSVAHLVGFDRMPPWRSEEYEAWAGRFADDFAERALQSAARRSRRSHGRIRR